MVHQEQVHYSPYQQAIWLSQRAECLQEPSSADQWIALLIHSLQDKTLANWQKASLWLDKQHQIVQLVFLKN